MAHASHLAAFVMSLDASVDVITHVPTDAAVDQAVARRLVDEGRIAIPTLTVAKTPGRHDLGRHEFGPRGPTVARRRAP